MRFPTRTVAMRGCAFAAGYLALLAPPSGAAPNGYTQIPIAKVFGDGVASFSIARVVENSQYTTYTTQYGFLNKFEAGIDYQAAPADQRTFLTNFKWLVVHKPGHLPDIAVGLENVATGQQAVPYAVATTQPRALGVSAGIIRPNVGDAYYGMGGLSYNITPNIQLVTDYIGGRADYTTYGFIATVAKNITVNAAYAQPNSAGNASNGTLNNRGYILNVAYTFHLRGGGSAAPSIQNSNPTPAAASGS